MDCIVHQKNRLLEVDLHYGKYEENRWELDLQVSVYVTNSTILQTFSKCNTENQNREMYMDSLQTEQCTRRHKFTVVK